MSNSDHLHGQKQHSAALVFNFIYDLLIAKKTKPSVVFFIDLFTDNARVEGLGIPQEVCANHALLAGECLYLQSLAFLTDEQTDELASLREKLNADWLKIISDAGHHEFFKSADCHSTLEKCDSLFLSQLEWMKDVGFEFCSKHHRSLILSESPVFEFLEIG
ncbi:MAG: hypothetical protein RI953_446 [Pseudomonadota bacterium]|jgi:hypothetical protein